MELCGGSLNSFAETIGEFAHILVETDYYIIQITQKKKKKKHKYIFNIGQKARCLRAVVSLATEYYSRQQLL